MLDRWIGTVAAVLPLLFAQDAVGAGETVPEEPPILSFQSENDLYGDSRDRWYTNGFRLALAYAAGSEPSAVAWIRALLPSVRQEDAADVFVAIGQNMYTPSDLTADRLLAQDRPYAGRIRESTAAHRSKRPFAIRARTSCH